RASEEVFEVRLGSDLERLLPPELLALHHPLLRRDFARRLVEGRLLSYSLRGADQRGRGPMIVCLDGSGSMAGDKEIWSKAVALTLLEIARRQRRLFRFICFSSADTPLFTLDLNPRERHEVQEDRALDVAEYFPGGGTDFETPLSAALDCLRAARYRRGDVVLITAGECRAGPEWLAGFKAEKARLGFALDPALLAGRRGPGTEPLLLVLQRRQARRHARLAAARGRRTTAPAGRAGRRRDRDRAARRAGRARAPRAEPAAGHRLDHTLRA